MINLYWLISVNTASMVSNLGGGRHRHLSLMMTAKEYMPQTGCMFVPTQKPGNYPPTMETSQNQDLGTERFRQNQALFIKYTAMDGALKNNITTVVQPVFLSPLMDNLSGFGHVYTLVMPEHVLNSYGVIYEINPDGNAVIIIGPYYPSGPLAHLMKKLQKRQ